MDSHTLIFDIETVGEKWGDLDTTTQEILSRWIDRAIVGQEAQEIARRDLEEGLGFSPLTGAIVAVGLYDLERARGVVYYQSDTETKDSDHGAFVFKPRTEKEMLEDFWEGASSYNTFVTFNGRGFDVPFMNLRSAIHGIRPSKDLMEGRYLYQQKTVRHIDLQDQLTFYGATRRRPSLHLFCRAFGIESPKAAGTGGDDVAELFRLKKYTDIAAYNAKDVLATAALYEKWCAYLAPRHSVEE